MIVVCKRMYCLRVEGRSLSFVRDGTEYHIQTPSAEIASAAAYLQTGLPLTHIRKITGASKDGLASLAKRLETENLLQSGSPRTLTGSDFYQVFKASLADWLREAFSGSYWDVMLSGRGSPNLYAGYLYELYHYTKNAGRHMPLAVANCPTEWKGIKRKLATHYFEECNHYGFFATALSSMGVSKSTLERSEPLPSTLEMSNFMRQAARTSTLCYCICSAILEGTTEDKKGYTEFFRRIEALYGIPTAAIQPVFDHLALDAEYDHKSLFEQICEEIVSIGVEESERAMSFGQQLVDHIFLWGEHILRYYGRQSDPSPLRTFDVAIE